MFSNCSKSSSSAKRSSSSPALLKKTDESTISGLSQEFEDGSSSVFTTTSRQSSAAVIHQAPFVPYPTTATSMLRRSSQERLEGLTLNKLRFSSLGLYGREQEIQTLRQACERAVKGTCHRQLVLISGCAGTGKSTLGLQQVGALMGNTHGFHVTGKFDLQQSDEPYSGIAAACRELCDCLLDYKEKCSVAETATESSSPSNSGSSFQRLKFSYEEIQSKLREELGTEGQEVLCRVVPNLAQIVDVDGELGTKLIDNAGGYLLENKNRFNFAFRQFLRVVGSFGPLVVTLDDLHWSDLPSLELIETLITDQENKSLMIVGCFRTENVDEQSSLSQTIRRIEQVSERNGIVNFRLEVANLGVTHVQGMLVDLLAADEAHVQTLAETVHRKTHGNPFFVVQFLTSLVQQDLLSFSIGSMKWSWNVEQISLRTSASGNVVDFVLHKKLENLPDWMHSLLPAVACLGSSFDHATFALVMDQLDIVLDDDGASKELERADFLSRCIEEGLLDHAADATYRWVHDKIQEAALAFISEDRLMALKFRLARVLYEGLGPSSLEKVVFNVANLFNEGIETVPRNDPWRLRIAELNLQAGVKAIDSSAFMPAINFLSKGIDLLPEENWRIAYKLSLDLFSTLAEAEYCVGDFDKMQTHCEAILAQTDRPLLDKQRAYNTLLDSIGARDRMAEAADLCIHVLSQLGCRFPKYGIKFFVVAGIIRTKLTLKRRTPEEIEALGAMTDEARCWAMTLLSKLFTYCYLEESDLLPLVVLKGLRWTIRYGVGEISAPMFALVGLTLAAHVGDFHGGKVYADRALALQQQAGSRRFESRTLLVTHAFVLHWTTPTQTLRKPLYKGYKIGMEMGDMESSSWCIFFYIESALHTGVSLDSIIADIALYSNQMQEFHQQKQLLSTLLTTQMILNLMGKSEHTFKLKGDVIDEDQVEKQWKNKRVGHWEAALRRMQMYLAFHFGQYESMLALIQQEGIDYFDKRLPGTFGLCPLAFHFALASISMARRTKNRAHRKIARKLARKIKGWVERGNPNVIHYDSLLDAELAALDQKNNYVVSKNFNVAILLAGRSGFVHDQALSHERFGEEYLRQGEKTEAEYQLRKAIKLYEEWGARAKADTLKENHASLLSPPKEIVVGK